MYLHNHLVTLMRLKELRNVVFEYGTILISQTSAFFRVTAMVFRYWKNVYELLLVIFT
jgi:hypothetical protein